VAGHNSRVRLNATHGNGYSEPADDFGIGVIGTASGNVIDVNNVTGNTNGILVGATTRQTMVRENVVVGNPGIQVANSNPNARAVDILNLSAAGQTTFERNTCVTSVNAPCPAILRAPQ
jgi:nitrous oxidase accessory protein NosD